MLLRVVVLEWEYCRAAQAGQPSLPEDEEDLAQGVEEAETVSLFLGNIHESTRRSGSRVAQTCLAALQAQGKQILGQERGKIYPRSGTGVTVACQKNHYGQGV